MLSNLFGKKKTKPIVNVNLKVADTIQRLKSDITTLEKKENYLVNQMTKLKQEAVEFKKNNKNKKALHRMKIYKLKDKQIDFILNSRIKLEEQINTLEQSLNNNIVISSVKSGAEALNKMNEEINFDEVAEVLDDINEKKNDIEEISILLTEPSTDFDDDELLLELEEEEVAENIKDILLLPSVPSHKIEINENKDEIELRKLEEEFQ